MGSALQEYKIQIKFEEDHILFFSGESYVNLAFKAQFDKAYIDDGVSIDCRYFLDLFRNAFKYMQPNTRFWNISVVLSPRWILQYNLTIDNLVDHQLEREAICYFMYNNQININDYEFFVYKSIQRAIAVKKTLIKSFQNCFKQFKLRMPVNFVI